ncbi:MAG TPA: SUMF1/EgtB/PvdO family nonheme iron enzyme [Tepidisphaeraceae bacterium]|nr:SUMF1/EgtB/PvdO family nonheme iron enzyme [Tepidisphaeraceae bacterium]
MRDAREGSKWAAWGAAVVIAVAAGGCDQSNRGAVNAGIGATSRPVAAIGDRVELAELGAVFVRVSPAKYGLAGADFYMLETEVTNAMYARYLKESGAHKEDGASAAAAAERLRRNTFSTIDAIYTVENPALLWGGDVPPAGKLDYPVALLNPNHAAGFCAWLTKNHPEFGTFRLPSGSEWLVAAYGKDRNYPWGDEEGEGRFLGSGFRAKGDGSDSGARWDWRMAQEKAGAPKPSPEPVKSRPTGRTPEGLYGMWGNVSEFVIHDVRKENKWVVGLGAKWMGGGFDDDQWEPGKDYWGYTHNVDRRDEATGFRVLLDPSDRGRTFKQRLGEEDPVGGSIYGDPDEWPRPPRKR